MLTKEQVQDHLAVLRTGYDPKSPFYGMIDFSEGLLDLPIPQQQQVFDAMPSDLRVMVMGK